MSESPQCIALLHACGGLKLVDPTAEILALHTPLDRGREVAGSKPSVGIKILCRRHAWYGLLVQPARVSGGGLGSFPLLLIGWFPITYPAFGLRGQWHLCYGNVCGKRLLLLQHPTTS